MRKAEEYDASVDLSRSQGTSREEHRVDAWVSSADEGRGTRRNAPTRRVQPQAVGGVRMGKPAAGKAAASREGREPGEVKHLSSPRKREDSASSGERKRKSLNRPVRRAGLWDFQQGRELKPKRLGRRTAGGESPVGVGERLGKDPEYHRTREIRWEAGPTTVQG